MVYETMNMHYSADMLFISRQALKQMIHTLEKEIGQPLFINDKNKLRATKAADELYEYSRDVVASFGEFQNKLNNQFGKSKHSITLHCGIQHSYFAFLSQHQKTRMREPQASCFSHTINVEYSAGTTYDLKQRVAHGALDCAYIITTEEDSRSNQLLDYHKIWGGGGGFS
jgi:DNA-binding transcriptional LysR family regulator